VQSPVIGDFIKMLKANQPLVNSRTKTFPPCVEVLLLATLFFKLKANQPLVNSKVDLLPLKSLAIGDFIKTPYYA